MWSLPVNKLFMVGSKTKQKLNSRGVYTIGELAKLDINYIKGWLNKPGLLVWNYANGRDNTTVRTNIPLIKSLSNSTTTPNDIDNEREAYLVLLGISEMLGMRIRSLNMFGSVISISIKDNNFMSFSIQKTIYLPTNCTNSIYHHSKDLFNKLWNKSSLRQFSISIYSLISDELLQLSLFQKHNQKKRDSR